MSKQTIKYRKNKKKIWIYIIVIMIATAFYITSEKLENKIEKDDINDITSNRNKFKYRSRKYRNIYFKKYTTI